MMKSLISVKFLVIGLQLQLATFFYLRSFEDKMTLTISDISSEDPLEAAYKVQIKDLIFPPKSPDFVFQQIAFMGVTGREWYQWFNLVDLFLFSHLAAFTLFCTFQLLLNKYEELYWIGRGGATAAANYKNGWVQWFREGGYTLAQTQWTSDFVENISIYVLFPYYPKKELRLLRFTLHLP
jgi:hypothetical protein